MAHKILLDNIPDFMAPIYPAPEGVEFNFQAEEILLNEEGSRIDFSTNATVEYKWYKWSQKFNGHNLFIQGYDFYPAQVQFSHAIISLLDQIDNVKETVQQLRENDDGVIVIAYRPVLYDVQTTMQSPGFAPVDIIYAGFSFVPGKTEYNIEGETEEVASIVTDIVFENQNSNINVQAIREQIRERREQLESERERERQKYEQACQAARNLLLSNLTPKQREHYIARECFEIIGANGRKYIIEKGRGHNVHWVENGRIVETYCVIFESWVIPVEDLVLTHKLMLECCPDEFFRIANIVSPRNIRRVA